jgi:hypothetical protein
VLIDGEQGRESGGLLVGEQVGTGAQGSPGTVGAPGRIRTCDRWIRSPLLYPLSYERLLEVLASTY